jgi:hypothetical protein
MSEYWDVDYHGFKGAYWEQWQKTTQLGVAGTETSHAVHKHMTVAIEKELVDSFEYFV